MPATCGQERRALRVPRASGQGLSARRAASRARTVLARTRIIWRGWPAIFRQPTPARGELACAVLSGYALA